MNKKICAWCYYARMKTNICGIYCTGGFENPDGTCDHFKDSRTALTERTVCMETDKLIEALLGCMGRIDCRKCPILGQCNGTFDSAIHITVEHIKTQAAEIDRLSQLAMMREGEIGDRDRELAALTAALIDCGYDDGSICNYCANDGACEIETNEYVQKKGSCFVWRGPQEAGEGEG